MGTRVEKIENSCWPSLSNKAFVPFRLYEKMIAHRALAAATSRAYAKRSMSDAPKMHKAKDVWRQIEATRPKDDHPHNVFHPPYNKVTAFVLVFGAFAFGYGSMYAGMRHQQYKQGYWK